MQRDLDNGSATLFRANIIKKGTNDLVDGFDYGSYPTDGQNNQSLSTKGANMRLRWNLDDMTLHSITGYESAILQPRRRRRRLRRGSAPVQPSGPGYDPVPGRDGRRAAGPPPVHAGVPRRVELPGPLQWIGGVFFFDESISRSTASASIRFTPWQPAERHSTRTQFQTRKSWAAFGR
jgi:iron complex outermembrane receptor protein